jgi:hypothetical protein
VLLAGVRGDGLQVLVIRRDPFIFAPLKEARSSKSCYKIVWFEKIATKSVAK